MVNVLVDIGEEVDLQDFMPISKNPREMDLYQVMEISEVVFT